MTELFTFHPIGTRVRHKVYPELAGTIERHERQDDNVSLLYHVKWDDETRSRELLGVAPWLVSVEKIELGEAKRQMSLKEMYAMRPCDVKKGDCFAIKIVAVAGHADDWAAYVGPTNWTDEEVAQKGDKLLASQAEPLFYVLRESGRIYRE